ncbi:MAG: hypothetical protein ACK5MN_10575 [Lachnospiraceae bacterium]
MDKSVSLCCFLVFGKIAFTQKYLACLIQSDGRVHDDVREIVLAATTGSGLDLKLISPLAE